jgi:glycosyltransferase involved in cell wall biosynthesis
VRVGIDGRAFSSPSAGVRRYVHSLVPALLALPDPPEIVHLDGISLPTNLGWALTGLPLAARRAGVDVIHAPAYTGPLVSSIPVVLTIHDVSYERHPEWYPYRRDRFRRAFYRRSARAAAHILTDSEFSADEIVAAYGIDRARITVAPLGVTSTFAPAPSAHQPSHSRTLAPSLSPPPPRPLAPSPPGFVLHVGDLHERRNLAMVLDAVIRARRRGAAVSLIAAGVDRGVGPALEAAARAAGDPGALQLPGAVDEARLVELYRTALALVYPSRYEGFGLPVVEAMATGTPVIASRAGSIPEVLGDAGVLLGPDDVTAWADAIVEIASDADRRARMRELGVGRAATFTWQRTARLTRDVYRQVLAR